MDTCQQLGLCHSAHPYLVSGEKCHSQADALQDFSKVLPILRCSVPRYLWSQRWSLCAQRESTFCLLGFLRLPLPVFSEGDLWQGGLFPEEWMGWCVSKCCYTLPSLLCASDAGWGGTSLDSRFPQACLGGAGRVAALPLPSSRTCAPHLHPPVSSRCHGNAAEAVVIPARLHLPLCRVIMQL